MQEMNSRNEIKKGGCQGSDEEEDNSIIIVFTGFRTNSY